MDIVKQFFDTLNKAETAILATASDTNVTMRIISPVIYEEKILFFTFRKSEKFRQLTENPHCSISAGHVFAEATAEFCGQTMLDANAKLRKAYCEKFAGAFDQGIKFGGHDAEFILLTPTRLKGWAFENDSPAADGIPTVPVDIDLHERNQEHL